MGGQASVLSRRVSLIAGTREKEEKKIQEKGNVAAAKHLEVAFFTLSVFPLFFSSPHVIVFCINPFTSLRASRRLVCFFFFTFFNPHLKKKKFNMLKNFSCICLLQSSIHY